LIPVVNGVTIPVTVVKTRVMHATLHRPSARLTLVAAIALAIGACLFVAIRLGGAAIRPAPSTSLPSQPAKGFEVALDRKPTKRPKIDPTYAALDAEAKDRIDASLEPVAARYHVPEVMRLGHPNTVVLVVDPAGAAASSAAPGQSIPVVIKIVRGKPANLVLAQAWAEDTDAQVELIADLGEEKQELRPGASVSWSWKVTPAEAGTLMLRVSTVVKADPRAEEFPRQVGEWAIPIGFSWWDQVRQFFGEINILWAGMISAVTGLASAIGLLRMFGVKPFGRAGEGEAELST
jgi:hypothetical protein